MRVTFLKICDQHVTLFKLDKRYVSDVPLDEIIKKGSVLNLITKGNRVFYQLMKRLMFLKSTFF